jgi:hypothetical protein
MRLRLVLTNAAAAVTGRALARLARYARRDEHDDADAAIAQALGIAHAAPFAALGAGVDPGDAYVLRADPVALVAGRDDVLLQGRVDDLCEADARTLVAMFDRHFALDGLRFHAPRPNAWFVTARAGLPVEADVPHPDMPLRAHFPRGPHAATWRRWLSEMQMLLHEHPVNAARERDGRAPVTGVWISGGGPLPARMPPPRDALFAAPSREGDIVRGVALRSGTAPLPPPAAFADLPRADAVVVTERAGWFDESVAALERRVLAELTVILVGGRALRYHAARPSAWQRLRARLP